VPTIADPTVRGTITVAEAVIELFTKLDSCLA
jgi:hypothetical protein